MNYKGCISFWPKKTNALKLYSNNSFAPSHTLQSYFQKHVVHYSLEGPLVNNHKDINCLAHNIIRIHNNVTWDWQYSTEYYWIFAAFSLTHKIIQIHNSYGKQYLSIDSMTWGFKLWCLTFIQSILFGHLIIFYDKIKANSKNRQGNLNWRMHVSKKMTVVVWLGNKLVLLLSTHILLYFVQDIGEVVIVHH